MMFTGLRRRSIASVFVVSERHSSRRLLAEFARQFFRLLRTAEATHYGFDVMGGAMERDREQQLFGRRVRDSRCRTSSLASARRITLLSPLSLCAGQALRAA